MKVIQYNQLITFHNKIIKDTGGSSGVRDEGLLRSALNRPFTTFDGIDLYTTNERKIAAVVFSLISNHGFVDGNKRIGISVMLFLCRLNDIKLFYTQQELIDLGLNVADGQWTEGNIFNWIKEHKK